MNILLLPSLHGEVDLYLNLVLIGEYITTYTDYHVKIFDVNLYYNPDEDILNIDKLENDIKQYVEWADVVALSSYKMYIHNDLILVNIIRRIRNDIPILVGGWGPTCFPVEYLKIFKPYAILRGVHGQSLRPMLQLFHKIENEEPMGDLKSVGYITDNNIIIINRLDVVPEPSELPTISWYIEKFDMNPEKYVEDGSMLFPVMCSFASCPKYYTRPCAYCSIGEQISRYVEEYGIDMFNSVIRPRLTYFNYRRAVNEIENAYNLFSRVKNAERFSVVIVDDCLTPANFRKLLEEIIDRGIDKVLSSLKFQTRPEYVAPILRIVRKICPEFENKLIIDVGIEYFSNRDLERSNRGYDRKVVEQCLRDLSESCAKWTMYVILTTPWSTAEDLVENIEGAIEWSFHTYLLRTNPYIFEEATPLTRILDHDKFKYIYVDNVEIPVRPRFQVSRSELERCLEIVEKYIRNVEEFKRELISSDGRGEKGTRLDLVIRSLDDLLESLRMLRDAIEEDLEYYYSQ